jgi:hypothetical protein
MRTRSVVGVVLMALALAGGCQTADPNPARLPSEVGGDASANLGGSGGAAANGSGASGRGGAPAEAGASGHSEAPPEGGAAGGGAASTAGGSGGEDSVDDCKPACSSAQTCLGGVCVDQDCPPSASFCSGGTVRTCADNGLSSLEAKTCSLGTYCDPDSGGCKTGYSSCPNVYLGSGRFGANPRSPSQANDAIVLNSYEVLANTAVAGQVRVNNLGSDDSPSTHISLYLSEPNGNFPANQNQLILEQNAVIPGATIGGTAGEYSVNWSYTFSTPGHYVLLARLENNSPPTRTVCLKQGYDTASPTTDALTAIHYLNVVE